MLNRPEILAPAGSMEALKAAVCAGADACYVGGSLYSARAFAGNFDTTELLEAIDYCHINNVKLYMAVNTLLKNDEIAKLTEYMEPFYLEGVDGVIVQDMGVIHCLSNAFPTLPPSRKHTNEHQQSIWCGILKAGRFIQICTGAGIIPERNQSDKKRSRY